LFDIADRIPKVRVREYAGKGPLLPEVTHKTILLVETLRVGAVCSMKYALNGIRLFRNRNEVDVICHQTVATQAKRELMTAFLKQLYIVQTVGFISKHV
jgi:hypothetical protein